MTSGMTSRERVLTAFAHREPDRVPAWLGAPPEFIALALQHHGQHAILGGEWSPFWHDAIREYGAY